MHLIQKRNITGRKRVMIIIASPFVAVIQWKDLVWLSERTLIATAIEEYVELALRKEELPNHHFITSQ